MPYIKQEERKHWETYLNPILKHIKEDGRIAPGELNYFISSIIWTLFDDNPSYTKGNELVGVLECVKQEFIRRRLDILENIKLEENGDICSGNPGNNS